MHVCLVSAYPQEVRTEESIRQEMAWLQQSAMALCCHGHQVTWISSMPHGVVIDAPEVLPPTCRYVIPCRPGHLEQVPLLVVEDALWCQPDLHTRLFTFFGLLWRASPWDILHVWGLWSVLYLGAYTARFLQCPLVVSYGLLAWRDGLQQTFSWQWVSQQPLQAVVQSDAEYATLAAYVPVERMQVLPPSCAAAPDVWVELYRKAIEHW